MEYSNIILSREKGLAVITINRPKAYNAMNTETLLEMEDLLSHLNRDPEIRALIITGGSKVFVAGADVTELMDAGPREALANCSNAHRVFSLIENMSVPVIAAINGPALGGGLELALSCDFRICGEKALLGLPEVTLGIIPGAGGTQRLAKLVGPSRAKEIIMLGLPVKAPQALEMGIITRLVPDDEVLETSKSLAATLMERPAMALKLAKESINFCCNNDLEIGKEFEKSRFGLAFTNPDQKEGMKAFVEKRKPNFTHIK